MKRKVLVSLLSLCILVGLLPATAMAEGTHSHAICYGTSCADPSHSSITWEAWLDAYALPDAAGSYYLISDVTLSETWTVSTDINLDLNGHTIVLEAGKTGSVINIASGTFNLTDCGGTGKVTGGNATNGGGVYVSTNAVFNLYGGSITGSMTTNVYAGGDIYKGGTFNAYGGVYGGTWGGIDWTLTVKDSNGKGKLTIAKTTQDPDTLEIMPKQPAGKTGVRFQPGYWREGICYSPEDYYQPWDKTKVTELEIKSGVTGIGTFSAIDMPCTGELYIPKTVNYIGWEAFNGAAFSALTFEPRDQDCEPLCIAQGAFKKLNMTTLELPEGLKCIHAWVFIGCPNLTHVSIPASVERMSGEDHRYDYGASNNANGSSALFAACNNLKTITFADENDRNMFLNNGVIGAPNNSYAKPVIAAYAGLTGYADLQAAIDAAAAGDKNVTMLNNITVQTGTTVEIPEGVTVNLNGKTLTNNATIVNWGLIDGNGTINNNGVYAAEPSSSSNTVTISNQQPVSVYTIAYELNGGVVEGSNPDYFIEGDAEFNLINPTKDGYKFKGWSGTGLTGDENQAVTVDTSNLENQTFTANWTANAYMVKFDANSGSGAMADVSVAYDEEKDLPANTFVNPGKLFAGWNTAEDGTGTAYTDGQSISNLTAEDGATVTLYAQWSDKPAQAITFDTTDRNATYGDGKLAKRAASAEGTITYTSSDTTVATVDADGVVTVLKVGETVITATAAETARYAAGSSSYKLVIAPKTLTVTADSQEANVGSSQPVLTCTVNGFVGTDTFITNPTCTTEADMNSTGIYDIIPGGADAGSNYTITYVKGTLTVSLKKYTVTYKADGKVVDAVVVEHGKDATAPTIPAKEGYNKTAPTWDKDGKNITADTEINAVYTINKYTVTYKADGKVVDTVVVEHGKDATAPTIPAKEGYTGAWDKDGKKITADTEINTVYTINKYTVTYKADGKVVDTVVVEHGKDAAAPTIPAKKGYTGTWDKDGKNITADTEINAVYTPISVTPATGDNNHGFLWLTLLFGSGCAIAMLTAYDRKRRNAVKD